MFLVDDVVECCGVKGIVREVADEITVIFEGNITDYFLLDGKRAHWHRQPLLKLIERPKKKIKKKFYFVSYQGSECRESSVLSEILSDFDTVFCGQKDRQIHEIIIEVEE